MDELLITTRALQNAIFNSANFSSIATDAKGVIQIFNVGAERMLGYAATDVINKITPADISDSFEVVARAKALSAELNTPITPGFEALVYKASRGIEDIYELTYVRKDGSRFPAVVSVTALRDDYDAIIGYLLIGTDNTARKEAEAALLRAGALQNAIFNSANFSSIATDAKGVIQIFNVGAERMLGYVAADVVNKITPADISDSFEVVARAKALSAELNTPITPGFEALVYKASRGIEDIYELTYVRKDGSRFPAVVSVTALRDDYDAIIGYLLIGTDNTVRKALETKVEERTRKISDLHRLLSEVLESLPFAVAVYDTQHRLALYNELLGTLLDYPPKLLENEPRLYADLVRYNFERGDYPDRTLEEALADFLNMMDSRQDIRFERKMPNGTFLDIRALPISEGWTLIIYTNITDDKQAEDRLKESQRASEAANLAKSAFIANMSHEIRTPMNAILGLAYLLEKMVLPGDGNDLVRKIRMAGRSLLGIINDILDFSKIDSGKLEIEKAPFHLGDVIDNLATIMTTSAGAKNIELIIHSPPTKLSPLLGDALRLEQVLINLTSNAVKFTEHGNVTVFIGVVEETDQAVTLHFAVRDTGIGIPYEVQQEIFAPFSQADSSTSRHFGGTGLGLTISRKLVALMGGELTVTSKPGEGSEFGFTLAFAQEPCPLLSAPEMANIEVLIVDDNEIALGALRNTVQQLGWTVTAFNSGEAALQHVTAKRGQWSPDQIFLLDWKMPGGMDGLATAKAVRHEINDALNPIIIMVTAFDRDDLLAQADSHLADAVLSKPLTASCLYNTVADALRLRRGNESARLTANLQRLSGLRIQVVDDSDINREVAQRIFSGEGAHVILADDGRQAVNWLQSHQNEVDIVLMDVQMPFMNGYEATKAIRRVSGLAKLPVIALTAGNFLEIQTSANEAGMNGFIAKPFDVDTAIALIIKLTEGSDTLPPAQMAAPVIGHDLPGLALDRGLATWKDPSAYRQYLRKFVFDYADSVAKIAHLENAAGAAMAHKLKGAAGSLALNEVSMLAGEIDKVLRAGEDPADALLRMQAALATALKSIAQYAPANDPPENVASGSFDHGPIAALLAQLLVACNTDSRSAVRAVLAELDKIVASAYLTEIHAALEDFDLRGAEVATQSLANTLDIQLGEGH